MSCLRVYSKNQDGTIIIYEPFSSLWAILRNNGRYVAFPELPFSTIPPGTMKFRGVSNAEGLCVFDQDQIDLVMKDYNCAYEVRWKSSSTYIEFYSPIRQYSNDRLYLNVDNDNQLTSYDDKRSQCIMKFVRLVVKTQPQTKIQLKIRPVVHSAIEDHSPYLKYCHNGSKHKVRVFDVVRDGVFYDLTPVGKFKKLSALVKKSYDVTSIKDPIYVSIQKSLTFKSVTYNNILSKEYFQSIFTVTTQILPEMDRRGVYGIAINKSQDLKTSARVNYKFQLSEEIITTPDVIVTAVYFNSGRYSEHRVKDQVVSKTHQGPYPSRDKKYLEGTLLLESTAIDVALLISNSLYGLLPTNGEDPDDIVKFIEVSISYDMVTR